MAKQPKEVKPHETEVITSQLADIIGKSAQWIRQLTRDGILKQTGRGKYKLGEAVQAYIRHVEGETDGNKVNFRDERAEHEKIKKEIAYLELEEKRKNLHTTEDVQNAWGMLLVEFRGRLSSYPPKLANELSHMTDTKAIRILLESKINEALKELAKYDPLESDGP